MFLLFILMLILPLLATLGVKLTFSKYSKVDNSRGLTADQVARSILDSNGLYNVKIERIKGNLTDHYDPTTNVVRLSESVYGKTSVAAIGVAAHECGHACQHAEEYAPIVLRSKLVPVVNLCSKGWYIVFLIALIFSEATIRTPLIYISIFLFLAVVLFQIVTLPVEFDASSRALKTLENDSILEADEVSKSRKVLTAAAMTYVTALVTSILQLIRLILVSRRR